MISNTLLTLELEFEIHLTSKTIPLRIRWRLSTILKTSKKSVWSNVFWYVKVCIFWKCIQHTIHWDKTQMLKTFPSEKINGTQTAFFFFYELQLITVLFLICNSYMSWSTRFVSKSVCGIFHFRFRFVFIKAYIFFSTKWMDFLILKRHNSFQKYNSRKVTHTFTPDCWFLSYKNKF